jgi:hypothetical protein
VTVGNNGPDAAGPTTGQMTLRDVLPPGTGFVNVLVDDAWTCNYMAVEHEVHCSSNFTLALNETTVLSVILTAPEECGEITNSVGLPGGLGGDGGDPDPPEDAVESTSVEGCVEPKDFQKYTSLEDKVLQPFELFSWYIDVPAQDGAWVLFDVLPFGMWVLSVDAPAGVLCGQFGFGIVCTGNTSETVTIEIHVIASAVCGQYTNVAKLTSTFHDVQLIPDTVQVCGEELQEEIEQAETQAGLFSTGQSWWSRLWLGLFSR